MDRQPTLKEKIVRELYKCIENGEYKADDIITESAIVAKYHISRAPVREALQELCQDEVIKSIPRAGYRVIPITFKEVLDIIDFRHDLEIACLERTFQRITPDQLSLLRKAAEESTQRDTVDALNNWTTNLEFHLQLCKPCGNDYSYRVLEKTLRKSRQYMSQYFYSAWGKMTESKGEHHYEIVSALEQRDLERAKHELSEDILAAKKEFHQIYAL